MKRPGSGAILRASFRTLRANPRLLWFPVVTLIGAVVAVGFGATLAWLGSQLASVSGDPEGSPVRGLATGGFVTLVLLQLWSMLSAVALSRATMDAMAGRDWSFGGSVRSARGRLGAIATVAVAQAGVGRLLRKKPSEKKGFFGTMLSRVSTSVLEMAWWAVTYLIVPVLAKEKCNGISALRRSGKLFKKTWKEAFIGRLALGWVWAGFGLLAVVPLGICVYLGIEDPRWLILAIAAPGSIALFGVVFMRTLDMIYRTALYVFATEGVVPEPFDQPELHDVFVAAR